jgi:hypothetical protein
MELNEFLGESSPAEVASPIEPVAPAPAAAEPEAPAEQPRNERGQFVKPDEPAPVTTTPEEKPHTVPVSALTEERRRRQEAEARLAALTAQAPVDVKDEDYWEKPVEATQKIVAQTEQRFQAQLQTIRYDIAEDATRSQFTDYDQVREAFIARHQADDPAAIAIAQQMSGKANPARFMYEQAKRLEAAEKFGNPEAFEARVKAEVEARIQAETGKRPAPQNVPRSLNAEPSQVTPSDPQSFEPTPLENLVQFNF